MSGGGVPFPAFIGRKVHIFIGNAENEANQVMMLVLRVEVLNVIPFLPFLVLYVQQKHDFFLFSAVLNKKMVRIQLIC